MFEEQCNNLITDVAVLLFCVYQRGRVETMILVILISRMGYIKDLTSQLLEKKKDIATKFKKVQKLVNISKI